ncbi:PEBP-like protein [Aspergillus ellipticus CBS 707.79]|uniref:PEBP-like protein n=1 Tax=Aspergillus ellipticus CBS 707.79 TaxID=1448320 RepID=A0A319D9L5_9EURO|nr:PEBP-like protein [Aspergillus ellipticus CBS 707.79]
MPSSRNVDRGMALLQIETPRVLGLNFGSIRVDPGDFLAKRFAENPPTLTFRRVKPHGTYMVVCLDLDAPFACFGFLGPVLHWIQPGLKPAPISGGFKLRVREPFVANYIGPSPPPCISPHRYVFLLFEQPVGFDVHRWAPPDGKTMGSWRRMRFDLDAWGKRIGLGPVLAFNYFVSK